MIMFMSCLLFSLTAPLIMSITMIFLCLLTALHSFSILSDPWCSIIFLMIFFGGLLVLFVYISTLAHNEVMTPSPERILFLSPLILMSFHPFSFNPFWYSSPISITLFDWSKTFLVGGMISYLLFALFIVAHLTFFHFGALRKIFVDTS